MINYEDENKRKLEKDDIRKIIISIVIGLHQQNLEMDCLNLLFFLENQ